MKLKITFSINNHLKDYYLEPQFMEIIYSSLISPSPFPPLTTHKTAFPSHHTYRPQFAVEQTVIS